MFTCGKCESSRDRRQIATPQLAQRAAMQHWCRISLARYNFRYNVSAS